MLTEISLGILALWLAFKLYQRPANFPPGPRGLPIIGYIPFLSYDDPKNPFKALKKLSDSYGPVVGFYLGPSQPFISICGYEAVKEVLHNDNFNGRPVFKVSMITDGLWRTGMGVIFSMGDVWLEHRRFTLRHLRDLGFGKGSIENHMHDEIQDLIDDMRKRASLHSGNIVNFSGIFNVSVLNVLWMMVAGSRFRRDDARSQCLHDALDNAFRSGSFILSSIQLPEFLLRTFPILRKFGTRNDLFLVIQKYIVEAIEERRKLRNDGNLDDAHDCCFIDSFLSEMDRQKDNPDSTFSREQLILTVLDLFIAGSETTSNSIGFVLLHLIHHPEIQEKMQTELDNVCGDRLPSLADKPSLTYTEAVLMESLRVSSVAPSVVPHLALKDTKCRGYTIPKGSIVSVNLYSVLMDPTYWDDPEVFRPERHLDTDGKMIKSDYFIPFGTGKRMCMGESLAKHVYFLFTASLVKSFHFKPVSDQPLPTLKPRSGFTMAYDGFEAVLIPRS